MPTRRRTRFVYGQLAWMLAAALALSLIGALSYELFFVSSLIGFLIVGELTAPVRASPAWRRRLRWLLGAGIVLFAGLVARRFLAGLSIGVISP